MEEGAAAGSDIAFLCSAPLNLAPGAEALREGFNRVYELKFLLSLRKKVMAKESLVDENDFS